MVDDYAYCFRNDFRAHSVMSEVVTYPNGTKEWYNSYDELHREDGPAAIWYEGTKQWFRDGLLHRQDGPAIIYSPMFQQLRKTKIRWFLKGNEYTFDNFVIVAKWSGEDIVMYKLSQDFSGE